MEISIIGAGIGGLTLGLALERKGFNVQIFEARKKDSSEGAGILLAPNASEVYRRLGVFESISTLGSMCNQINICDAQVKSISSFEMEEIEPFMPSVAIHRNVLKSELIKNFQGRIHFEKAVQSISSKNVIRFQDGTTHKTDYIIGADGIHSTVRKTLFPKVKYRNSGQKCFRGVVKFDLPEKFKNQFTEIWDGGKRFGFTHIGNGQVYWFAVIDDKTNPILSKSLLIKHFQTYNDIVHKLIENTDVEKMSLKTLKDIKPFNGWTKNGVCLMGDAAHPTTPNMGQGACQAIEDAFVLAELIETIPPPYAFREFEKIRKEKVNLVVERSWKIGKVAHLSNPIIVFLRNQFLKLTPKRVIEETNRQLFDVIQFQ
jgi:2-polyprenyl-6-methoxyphenol hydroxylase-like FAD-dependent oxidoreductase